MEKQLLSDKTNIEKNPIQYELTKNIWKFSKLDFASNWQSMLIQMEM